MHSITLSCSICLWRSILQGPHMWVNGGAAPWDAPLGAYGLGTVGRARKGTPVPVPGEARAPASSPAFARPPARPHPGSPLIPSLPSRASRVNHAFPAFCTLRPAQPWREVLQNWACLTTTGDRGCQEKAFAPSERPSPPHRPPARQTRRRAHRPMRARTLRTRHASLERLPMAARQGRAAP